MKSHQTYSLYLAVSDRCNFQCTHCAVDARSDRNAILTTEEIATISAFVNSQQCIHQVTFTGGEPTLHLDTLVNVQRKISRKVTWRMCTNGWFGARPEAILDRLNLDEIVVSYDAFHQPFVSSSCIRNLLTAARDRGINPLLSFTYAHISDLKLIDEVLPEGIDVTTQRCGNAGRFKSDTSPRDGFGIDVSESRCPGVSSAKGRGERIAFHPSRGSTVCSGSTLWNRVLGDSILFSPLDSSLYTHRFRSLMKKYTFGEIAARLGVNILKRKFATVCDGCACIFEEASGSSINGIKKVEDWINNSINCGLSDCNCNSHQPKK